MYEDIEKIDAWLDRDAASAYQGSPLALDWLRVSKLTEEAGEAVAALIGVTGGNPRKGVTHMMDDVVAELADVAATAMCAIQHFTKDRAETQRIIEAKVSAVAERAERAKATAIAGLIRTRLSEIESGAVSA